MRFNSHRWTGVALGVLVLFLSLLLTAYTPGLEPTAGQERPQENASTQPEVCWAAQVSRVKRHQDSYLKGSPRFFRRDDIDQQLDVVVENIRMAY